MTFAEDCEVIEEKKVPDLDHSHALDDTLEYADPLEPVLNLRTPELKAMEFSMEKLLEEHEKQQRLVIDMSGCLGDDRMYYVFLCSPSFTDETILHEKANSFT